MESWDLSPLYRHLQSQLLPDGTRLVSYHNGRVVLRAILTLQIHRTWSIPPLFPTSSKSTSAATSTAWNDLTTFAVAPTAPHYVLCYSAKAKTAYVLDPDQDEVVAKLEVGSEGAVRMEWAQVPADGGGRGEGESAVMAWSAHHLRLSLFRISSSPSPVLHILNPKHSHSSGHAFQPQGKFLAILERHNSRDVIGIYSTRGDWGLIRSITLPDPASDLAGLNWSPCGRYLATWSHITDYIVHFYLPTGQLLSTFSPYSSLSTGSLPSPTSTKLPRSLRKPAVPVPPEPEKEPSREDRRREERSTANYVGLGVRCVVWGESGEWVAVGGYDGRTRILSHHGFVTVADLGIPPKIQRDTVVWKEPIGWVEKTRGKGIVSFESVITFPYSLTPVSSNSTVPNPKMGFSRLLWSPSGEWLVGLNQTHPTALNLFSFPLPSRSSSPSSPSSSPASSSSRRPAIHTILLFNQSVRDFVWQPSATASEGEDRVDTLAIATGEKAFAVWRAPSLSGGTGRGEAEGVGIPVGDTEFSLTSLTFSRPSSSGAALLLSSPPPSLPSPGTGTAARERQAKDAGEGQGGLFCVAYCVVGEQDEGEGGGEGRSWIGEEE
ncbi:hypothetical protein JCM11641_003562 [Rhodosporidiobolus odoratus]